MSKKVQNFKEFFIPYASSAKQTEEVWQGIKTFAEETTGWPVQDDQRIFSIAFTHNGNDYLAQVGEPEPITGEPVIAILSSNCYLICTPNRGVLRGMPILVGYKDTFGIVPFSDYKGTPTVHYSKSSKSKSKKSKSTV
tara:strand:- start:28 stop:441 length:414 start_codon:yes stop_codon:yes gene_type:complete